MITMKNSWHLNIFFIVLLISLCHGGPVKPPGEVNNTSPDSINSSKNKDVEIIKNTERENSEIANLPVDTPKLEEKAKSVEPGDGVNISATNVLNKTNVIPNISIVKGNRTDTSSKTNTSVPVAAAISLPASSSVDEATASNTIAAEQVKPEYHRPPPQAAINDSNATDNKATPRDNAGVENKEESKVIVQAAGSIKKDEKEPSGVTEGDTKDGKEPGGLTELDAKDEKEPGGVIEGDTKDEKKPSSVTEGDTKDKNIVNGSEASPIVTNPNETYSKNAIVTTNKSDPEKNKVIAGIEPELPTVPQSNTHPVNEDQSEDSKSNAQTDNRDSSVVTISNTQNDNQESSISDSIKNTQTDNQGSSADSGNSKQTNDQEPSGATSKSSTSTPTSSFTYIDISGDSSATYLPNNDKEPSSFYDDPSFSNEDTYDDNYTPGDEIKFESSYNDINEDGVNVVEPAPYDNERGAYNNQQQKLNGEFTDDTDSHFFAYFLTIMVTAIVFYLLFHNKQRVGQALGCVKKNERLKKIREDKAKQPLLKSNDIDG